MSGKTKKKCYFGNCLSDGDSIGVRFFRFPKRNITAWIDACQNHDLRKLKMSTILSKAYVCSKHFTRNQFTMMFSPFKTKLKYDAIPGQSLLQGQQQLALGKLVILLVAVAYRYL